MTQPIFIITHDVGTTGNKSCLYQVSNTIELVDSCLEEYPLYTVEGGGVEQNAEEWWSAICNATRTIMERSGISPSEIKGMSFCAQMQGSIFVDKEGNALRNPMSYMDGRAIDQIEKYLYNGLIKIEGKYNAYKTLKSLYYTGPFGYNFNGIPHQYAL